MRIRTCLAPVAVGLILVAAYGRSDRTAAGDEAVSKNAAGTALPSPATLPPRTIEGFSFDKLPVGKTIGVEPSDARIFEALDKPAEFSLSDANLGDFAQQIRDKHKIAIALDVGALTADGKGTETILNGKIAGTSLRSALRLFLHEQGLTFLVRNETLMITTKTAAEVHTSTRIYQVHDLVLQPNDPAARPEFDKLTDLITSTLQPESWREAGGTQGEIRAFEGPGIVALVVQQTDEVHEQIEALLADLRAAKIPALLELQQKRERILPPSPAPTGLTPPVVSPKGVVGGAGFY